MNEPSKHKINKVALSSSFSKNILARKNVEEGSRLIVEEEETEKKRRRRRSDNVRPAIKGSIHRSKIARRRKRKWKRRRRRRRMIEDVRTRARDNPPYS